MASRGKLGDFREWIPRNLAQVSFRTVLYLIHMLRGDLLPSILPDILLTRPDSLLLFSHFKCVEKNRDNVSYHGVCIFSQKLCSMKNCHSAAFSKAQYKLEENKGLGASTRVHECIFPHCGRIQCRATRVSGRERNSGRRFLRTSLALFSESCT